MSDEFREGFDSNVARTWNPEERAVYETGYREGGSNREADWDIALDGVNLPTDLSFPAAAQRLADLLVSEHNEGVHDEPDEWCPKCQTT